MDFFASQDEARRRTSLLLLYFALAVVLIIVAVYLAITLIFFIQQGRTTGPDPSRLWNAQLFVSVAGITLLVIVSGSVYKIGALRSGGARVAEMLGGRLIPAGSKDFREKRLLNIVEEMSIASGVSVPPVYILNEEKGINAFAAGFTPDDAVIGITRGALETLNRAELQGVVAHEFSHIVNGDMRLDLKLVGFLHGILLIALIGYSILRGSGRGRSSKNSGGIVLFGLVLVILGYIGMLFAKLIKSAVSRQREYLADASAVQFTRNPPGLAGALKKIGGLAYGSVVEHNKAREISHMFFSDSLRSGWLQALSTHPPLKERIVRLDPTFDGTFPEVVKQQAEVSEAEIREAAEERAGEKISPATAVAGLAGLAAEPENITANIGMPVREHLDSARRLLDSLPRQVREEAGDPFGARAVIYGLLLDQDPDVRAAQMEHLRLSAEPPVFEAIEKILPAMLSLNEEARLPLMDIAMPSLRSLSQDQFMGFAENIHTLVRIDERISLFEFTLEHVIVRRLEKNYVTAQRSVRKNLASRDLAAEISCVLSLLAHIGHDDARAVKAFDDAAAVFRQQGVTLHYLHAGECGDTKLPAVLDSLTQLGSRPKQTLVRACFRSLVHDKKITMKEAEFFRLLIYALDIPLPPWAKI